MPFDPTKPATGSQISSAELRSQFNALNDKIDALPAPPPETDPVFAASEAAQLVAGDKAKLDAAVQPGSIQDADVVHLINRAGITFGITYNACKLHGDLTPDNQRDALVVDRLGLDAHRVLTLDVQNNALDVAGTITRAGLPVLAQGDGVGALLNDAGYLTGTTGHTGDITVSDGGTPPVTHVLHFANGLLASVD